MGTTLDVGSTNASDCLGFLDTSITWTSNGVPKAGELTGIDVFFTPQMNIRPGEIIVVGLPLFGIPSSAGTVVELLDQGGARYGVVAANASDSRPYNHVTLISR